MFRHVVMFRWREGVDQDAVAAACGELAGLSAAVPQVRSLSFGADAGIRADNHDLVVIVDFEDIDGYSVYVDHPAHVALVENHLRPLLAERAAVQYSVGDAHPA